MRSRDLAMGGAAAGALGVVVFVLALALPGPVAERVGRALSFWLLSVPPLMLAIPGWLDAGRRAADRAVTRWLFAAFLLAGLVPDRLAQGAVHDLVGSATYLAAALLITLDRPRRPGPLWRDPFLILALWIPMELGWVSGEFTFLRLFGLNILLLLFVIERPLFEPGRLVPRDTREIAWGVGVYAGFLAFAVPVAIATGFAAPGVADRPVTHWVFFLILTFWVIALPEEALFRGVIQNLLERATKRTGWALALAAVIFGLAHLDNHNGDPPDWRYVLLATLAGVAYGLAWLKTRTLTAPVLAHFLVDVTWRGFFAGPRM
jgi:membrane protease YdiL (CAAX protease family)